MLSEDDFAKWSQSVVLFCHITTRIEGVKNDDMLTQIGGRGFPTLKFMDQEGQVLAEPGGRDVEAFETTAKAVARYVDLVKKKSGGAEGLEKKLFFLELEMGRLDAEQAAERSKSLTFNAEEQKKLDGFMIGLEVMKVAQGRTPPSPETLKKFYESHQKGLIPTDPMARQIFHSLLLMYGDQEKNAKAFAAGVAFFKKEFGDDESAKGQITMMEERLKELEAEEKAKADKGGDG